MTERQQVYNKILNSLKKLMPSCSQSHLVSLTMMMTGIIMSKKSHLATIGQEVPTIAKDASVEKRLHRFVKDEDVNVTQYFLPFAQLLLSTFTDETAYLVIDSSVIGRGCRVSMVCILYKNRALPIGWTVFKGRKGHQSMNTHLQVLQEVAPLLENHQDVVFLGDAEFGTYDLLTWIQTKTKWQWVVRTSPNLFITLKLGQCHIGDLIDDVGQFEAVQNVAFTEKELPNIHVIAKWDQNEEKPLYLVTSIFNPIKAVDAYSHRFQIETFFSDQKSRGFSIDRSNIADPKRLSRLLLPACLSYIWIVLLGSHVLIDPDKRSWVDRNTRRDKSLFRLGYDWLKNALKRNWDFDICFTLPIGHFAQVDVR